MICSELPVYKKMCELTAYMDRCIVNLPREVKYSYGEDLRHTAIALMGEISLANYCIGNLRRRAYHLENCMGLYEKYKFCKRAIQGMRGFSPKQSAHIDLLLAEAGEQLMGWYRKYESSVPGRMDQNAGAAAPASFAQGKNGGFLPATNIG